MVLYTHCHTVLYELPLRTCKHIHNTLANTHTLTQHTHTWTHANTHTNTQTHTQIHKHTHTHTNTHTHMVHVVENAVRSHLVYWSTSAVHNMPYLLAALCTVIVIQACTVSGNGPQCFPIEHVFASFVVLMRWGGEGREGGVVGQSTLVMCVQTR